MVESMSNFAISLLLVIGYYWITEGDLNMAFSLTTGVAIFFMFPTFTLWSLAGLVFKTTLSLYPPYPPDPLSTPNGAERGSEVNIWFRRFG